MFHQSDEVIRESKNQQMSSLWKARSSNLMLPKIKTLDLLGGKLKQTVKIIVISRPFVYLLSVIPKI